MDIYFLSNNVGYMVIIPDYYRGQICDVTKENFDTIMTFLKTESKWEGKLKEDWEKSICPYATKHGAKSFGTIGKNNQLSFSASSTMLNFVCFSTRWQ